MPRGRAACLVVVAVIAVGCGGGGEEPPLRLDPLGEALAYLPAESLAVGVLATQLDGGQTAALRDRLARVPATELLLGLAGRLAEEAGLDLDALRAQAGHPVAVALPDLTDLTVQRMPLVAWRVRDAAGLRVRLESAVGRQDLDPAGTYRGASLYRAEDGAPAYARAGPVFLLAKDTDTLKLALDRRAQRRGITERDLQRRLQGTPATAPVRLSVNAPVALAGPDFAELRKIPWVAALERMTVAVGADDESITLATALDTSESDLVAADLPVSTGAGTPPIPEFGALRAGLREPAASVVFAQRVWRALAPSAARAFDAVKEPLARAGVDVDLDLIGNLAGPALLATDLQDSRLRVGLRDPEVFADALARGRFLLGPVFDALGLPGLQFTVAPDGATQVSANAVLIARATVLDGELVVSTREQDLERVARAPRIGAGEEVEGAFVLRMRGTRLRATAARLVGLGERAGFALDGVGDGTLVVRAEPAGVQVTLRLEVG